MKKLLIALLGVATQLVAQDPISGYQEKLKANPNDVPSLIAISKIYHQKGVEGNKRAVTEAEEYLIKALQMEPNHPVALAMLGSVNTLKGRDAWMPWNKMKYVEKGTDLLDKAVELDPNDISVRTWRGINSINLPGFFHRLQYALKDFDFIIKSKEFLQRPAAYQAMIYTKFGIAFVKDKNTEKAKENFQKALALIPNDPEANAELGKLEKKAGE